MKNKIIKRKYFAFELELDSPLSVMSGEHVQTELDVLRNGSGEPFVPGTSVAGAFRTYMDTEAERNAVMGFSNQMTGEMSSVFISDLYFDGTTVVISERNGVCLGEDKIAVEHKKFDLEIIETGARAVLYISYILRDRNQHMDFDKNLRTLLIAVNQGEIRFGSRKNRGFGKMCVLSVHEAEFDETTAEAWLEFQKNPKDLNLYGSALTLEEWSKEEIRKHDEKYLFFTVPLRLTGGISIRKYSVVSEEADYKHLTCRDKPIIPGSSWCGVIRSSAREILRELGCSNTSQWLNKWFGFVEGKQAAQSLVVVGESILTEGDWLPMTRNQIDRFDGSSKNGALYSESSWFGGTTELRIGVKKDLEKEYKALVGLLLLVVQDIQEGYTAVGGQTAVGRGVFSSDGEIRFSHDLSQQVYKEALLEQMKKEVAV